MVSERRVTKNDVYRVKAIWKTLQGEGLFAGRPAVFVRLVGCNLWSGYEGTRERDALRTASDCPRWCDTDFTKQGSQSFKATELAQTMAQVGGSIRFCVLTGGEPLLQINADLIEALHGLGFYVAVETNGTIALQDCCWNTNSEKIVPPDWIVCSPKVEEAALRLEYFDELKLVVPRYLPRLYQQFVHRQRIHHLQGHRLPLLWLQAEDGARVQTATQMAISMALEDPNWRVSVQTHKILDVE